MTFVKTSFVSSYSLAMAISGSTGGQGSGPPRQNHKIKEFLCNTGPDPLKITKLPIQRLMLDHILAVFGSAFTSSIKKNNEKKTISNLDPTLTKLSGSPHDDN